MTARNLTPPYFLPLKPDGLKESLFPYTTREHQS